MKKTSFNFIIVLAAVFSFAKAVYALPDFYIGDTAIYSGATTSVRPNVLFIVDNNSTMGNSAAIGDPYNPSSTYSGAYTPATVYKVTGMSNYVQQITDVDTITCTAAKTSLLTTGTYSGSGSSALKNDGSCGNGGAGLVYLGNLLNYNESSGSGSIQSQIEIVRNAVLNVSAGVSNSVNIGLMSFGSNKSGGKVLRKVGDISSSTAFANFSSVLPGTATTGEPLLTGNGRPLGEALYDAGAYFKGVYPVIGNDTSLSPYPSPISYTCQKNFIVVITNGDTDLDGSPKLGQTTALGTVADYDGDGLEPGAYGTGTHYMDDVAKFIYENDVNASLSGIQRVVTHAIQVFSPDKPLVRSATNDSHGRGSYHVASDANALSKALTEVMTNIVLEADTSFVAPVVPVSPENRTYSGSRVYMGFFKPISQSYWHGNLKKYGINSSNNITDKNGNIANYVDLDDNGYDDITGLALPTGAVNGTFKSTATSFWSSAADGGNVESGGAGEVLLTRNFATNPRNIYTYTGSNTSLTDSSNVFDTSNTAITVSTLGVSSSTERDNLINFVHGIDKYDENGNGDRTEKRAWIMGDVLHSKPLIVNYASFTFSGTNESNCSVNKSMIYVGSNDGMLHAINDCNGSEAWAFIPPDMLPNLQYITGLTHNYFADSSPSAYIFDKDNDGNIETNDDDRVILVFGQRRGGGLAGSPTRGYYYALDVSTPTAPTILWSRSRSATGFEEMAETWSEPKIVKMKIGGSDKIVAFVSAGYDNANEDSRYGATQTFSGTGAITLTDTGEGIVTSSGTSSPSDPKGRGLYAFEIATLSSGIPGFTNSGSKIKGYTHADNSDIDFSFPGEITALDLNNDGYTDRLYAGDTGGNIWRFNVGNIDTDQWTATKIFSSNPGSGGSSDTGRKIFYKPSAVVESGNTVMLFFGTGDREHPLNRGVVDRFYALKDKGQSSAMTESDLLDVTTDQLQTTSVASGSGSISDILANLNSSSNYGWYIKLNENSGEKVLAPPTVFNKVAYFTTYAPNTAVAPDPCQPGNLGTARLYAVDYKTGEAVLNYDTTNDSISTINRRALSTPGQVLVRSDRVQTLGSGIPSGIVLIINPNGGLKALIGVGGVIPSENPKKGGSIIPLYWRQK
ncbi:MAG: hypothetical protein H6Q57_399 [Geobacteraceae bacterium]|nr:hypothetical protein [Geobacteraceae bacterium]